MKTSRSTTYRILGSCISGLLLFACHTTSTSETETTVGDYKVPETIPLVFTEPEPFEWETITSDSLTTPVTHALDVDALPSKRFELNTFKPLKAPMKEYDLEWDSYPTEALKFDSVPFTITKSTIKKPTITKMKPPGIMDGTDVNLLQLSTNEGLPTNDVTSFLETEDGGVYIGASNSTTPLTYYDGENAFVYDYPGVYKMTFDKQGKLWLVSPVTRVLTVLDFKNDIAYTITKTDSFIPFDILCDHTGILYMASLNEGFYAMDPEMKSLQRIANKDSSRPWRLIEDSKDNLWLGFINGIKMLDKDRDELKTLTQIATMDTNSGVTDITEEQSGDIWLGLPVISQTNTITSSTLVKLSLEKGTVTVLSAENGYTSVATEIVEDNQGKLWIFGVQEAFILSENRNRHKTIPLNSTLQASLKIPRPLKRNDGSLWMATIDKGVVIANDFTLKTEYFDTSKGLINDQVWEIEESTRGEIWLGTNNGINIIDVKNNAIKPISTEKLNSSPNNTINFIEEVSKDIFFLNTRPGFSILDRQQNTITHYDTSLDLFGAGISALNEHTFAIYTNQGLFVYDIKDNILRKVVSKNDPDTLIAGSGSIMVYDEDTLWIPTTDGLARLNLKTKTISYLKEEQGICDNDGTVALLSKEGGIWIGTLDGIAILNVKENTLTNIKEENGLIPAEIYDLIERDTLIYAASVDGLLPISKKTAKTNKDGYNNFNAGLGFKSNDYLQGSPMFLQNGQFWSGVVDQSSKYKLMVLDGAPKPDNLESSVYITNMFVMDENPNFNERTSIDSLNNKVMSYATEHNIKWDSVKQPYHLPTGLVLPFDQNSLSFSYASGDLFNRNQLSYRFILDGEDEDWTFAGSNTKTKNYYNLKPGEYTFKVAARGFNKEWSIPASFDFTINPPWWQTWWAYLLFAFIFGGAVWSFVAYRSRWLQKENRLLEERVTHRTSQLKSKMDELKATQSQLIQSEKMASLGELTAGIAHEIQNPLNFVNNFSEVNTELIDEMEEEIKKGDYEEVLAISKDIKENQKKINHHGRRADAIVKGMLQHSRTSSSEKEPSNINAIADEYLRLSYHGLRAKDKSFNATLNTDLDETIGKINIVPQDIGRVILNLITNAFHACIERNKEEKSKGESEYKPTVWVSTKRIGNTVEVAIRDNGNGVPDRVRDKIFQPFFTTKPSGEGTGLGLSLSYDIVKTHGGELRLDTKQGEGTTFTISLPEVY
ncbi:ATP-binding protein [Maribacter chungangensis]|uniref:histidine kinase n=1 Tax=Maribacter chungangensis TaxID=1069117 RepID=A0ABW3B4P1_9FLAO